MKEEYVNEEVTRKLIDKSCPVRLVIKADEPIPILYELPKEHPNWQYCKAWYIPTISQVLRWLREEKRIDAGAVWDNRDGKWVGYINEMDMPDLVGEYVLPNTYDTYEQAALAGIKYILDNNLI